MSGRMEIVPEPTAPEPPIKVGAAVWATNWATPGPALVVPRLVPRRRRDAPAVTLETAPVLNVSAWPAFGVRVMVLPPVASVN